MTKLTKSLNILYQASTHTKFLNSHELCIEKLCLLVPRLGRDAVEPPP